MTTEPQPQPRQPTSPSPPPEPPTSTTSLPSVRFTALRKIYTLSLHHTLSANSYANFSACFPTPAQYCPRALEGVWKQLNGRLEEECLRDFEKICVERGVERGLAEWERLIEEARLRKETEGNEGQGTAVHMLSADELHSAHVAPALARAERELVGKLEGVQRVNREVMGSIEEQRGKMARLIEALEGLVEDVEGAAGVLEGEKGFERDVSDAEGDGDVKMGG